PMSPVYIAIGILVLGACVVLLSVGAISANRNGVALLGVPFAVIAAIVGLQAPQPLALAVLALSVVCGIALLLIPVLEPDVPLHVAEAAALLLLGTAGAIALAG